LRFSSVAAMLFMMTTVWWFKSD